MVANHTIRPESLPASIESGKVYVLDGRERDTTAMEIAVSDLATPVRSVTACTRRPLGELR